MESKAWNITTDDGAASTTSSNPLSRLYEGYLWTLTLAEPATQDWLWVKSPAPTLSLIFLFYNMVYFGPRLMRDRPAFRLKWLLVVYNLFLAALNLHIAFTLYYNAWYKLGYSIFCQPSPSVTTPEELAIATAIWWYWMSKFIEFGDTLFFILRKKDNQLTFLHVYHHSTMAFFWWIGVKWVPGGIAFFCAGLNSIVHVVMYSYYGLSALGPAVQKYLWWKKYLTIFQLVQFAVNFTVGNISIHTPCEYPLWIQYTLVGYMATFLVLFGNFYLQSYVKNKRGSAKKNDDERSAAVGGGVAANGVSARSSSSSSRTSLTSSNEVQHHEQKQVSHHRSRSRTASNCEVDGLVVGLIQSKTGF